MCAFDSGRRGMISGVLAVSALLAQVIAPNPPAQLAILNSLHGKPLSSLYVWETGTFDKGSNLLKYPLHADSAVVVQLDCDTVNILAFDALDNSYAVKAFVPGSPTDTISLDLSNLALSTPNYDCGTSPVNMHNETGGFALVRIAAHSPGLGDSVALDDLCLLSGMNAIIWLEPGIYSFHGCDRLGRDYLVSSLVVTADRESSFSFDMNDLMPQPTYALVDGSGRCSLEVHSALLSRSIENITIRSAEDDETVIRLDRELSPGECFLLRLESGSYYFVGTDDLNGTYSLFFSLAPTGIEQLVIGPDMLDFDFSLPTFDSVRRRE
jgi:hypothetical protein